MKKSVESCSLCRQIINIRQNPYFVSELTTGYVVLGTYQFFKGYTIFICKKHVPEIHMLPSSFQKIFLDEMAFVAKGVWEAFHPKKLNYELLGNTDPHLHWHIIPRYAHDPNPRMPIWILSKKERSVRIPDVQRKKMKQMLLSTLTELNY